MKLLAALFLLAAVASPSSAAAPRRLLQQETPTIAQETPTIAGIVAVSPDHKVLLAAVQAAGLADALSSEGEFTVFAPTDDAFAAALAATGLTSEQLLASPDLATILKYHVVPGTFAAADLKDGQELQTLQGDTLLVSVNSSGVFVNSARVTTADIQASNGIVHVTDGVLLPAAIAEALGASPGLRRLLQQETPTVAGIVAGSPDHTVLLAAVQAAGLADALSSEGEFTVFAPTDDAFAAALAATGLTSEQLLASPDLATILKYHVVPGTFAAADLKDGQELQTLQGDTLLVSVNSNGVFVNSARVTTADIQASNGIVHVTDGVLLPAAIAEALGVSPGERGQTTTAPAVTAPAATTPGAVTPAGQISGAVADYLTSVGNFIRGQGPNGTTPELPRIGSLVTRINEIISSNPLPVPVPIIEIVPAANNTAAATGGP